MSRLHFMAVVVIFISFLLHSASSSIPAAGSKAEISTSEHPDSTDVPSSASSSPQTLSVLLVSTWLSGHQTHLLGVGGELVKRGHKVFFLSTEVEGSNNLPHVPESLGMRFLSAGADPRSKAEYERIVSGMMGLGVLRQRLAMMQAMQEHMYLLRVAVDQLNCSDWDVALLDYTHSMNLARHLALTCSSLKIILSASSIIDYTSMAPPWPYPSMYVAGSSDNISLYHKLVSAIYQLFLTNSIGTLLTKLYLAGNDTVLWDSVYRDPYFFYPPDVLHPMLYYSVVGVEYAHPHYPNVHMVGPILSGSNASPLQDTLKRWLDAKEEKRVAYVSMGTTAVLTRDMAAALLRGVAKAGYSMVWSLRKSNRDVIEGVELDKERFFVSGWVSQVAVLRHPAIGLAIIHCGSGGLHEALSNSIPVVCIPFCFDQFSWAGKIQSQGLGVALSAEEVTPERVLSSIEEVGSAELRKRVEKISKVLRQAGGSKMAAELIEFYAEVGYDHLLTAPVKYRWGWVQYYSLDLYCLLTTTLLCGTLLCSKLCARKRP